MTIAEGLVLRKHLEAKVKQLEPIYINGQKGLFDEKVQRKNIGDNVDEITVSTPKVTLADVTAEYDKYSKALRELDTAIQKANWTAKLVYTTGPGIAV
jgi:hypothetical protein